MAEALHQGVIVDLVGEVLLRKGNVQFTVTSSSMEPAIRVGDRAEVGRLPASGPDLGDVVLFQDPGLGHVVHRVIWRWPLRGKPRFVYTKGDAACHRDAALPAERVLGRVLRVFRGSLVLEQARAARWRPLLRSAVAMVRQRLRAGRAGAAAPATERVQELSPEKPAEMIDSLNRQP